MQLLACKKSASRSSSRCWRPQILQLTVPWQSFRSLCQERRRSVVVIGMAAPNLLISFNDTVADWPFQHEYQGGTDFCEASESVHFAAETSAALRSTAIG